MGSIRITQLVETVFAPGYGIVGGILIGLSAVLLMLASGHIAGLSGIFSGLLTARLDESYRWRATFILGLLAGAAWTGLIFPQFQQFDSLVSHKLLIAGGLLVGIGVKLGSGCTSGHGICGVARLSPRSTISTCMYMTFAMAMVYVVRHLAGGAP